MGFGRQEQRRRLSRRRTWLIPALLLAGTAVVSPQYGSAQVFVVQQEKITGIADFKPTSVKLDDQHLTARTHQELIMALASEQGFARRPLPLGSHGLVLHANGDLSPSGLDYSAALQKLGVSAKAGDRIIISDVKIESNRIIFEFNGGPEKKHRLLRHLSVGAGGGWVPLQQDDGQPPTGSRLTLVFDKYVPEMTGDQLRSLIQPIIDFSVKTPVEAYADTLPPKLKAAILNHELLVGMDRKMVLYSVGQPIQKVREKDGNGQFEEWIYGEAPKPTQFVRFTNDRVTRIEVAEVGQAPIVRDKDETDGYLAGPREHNIYLGDAAAGADDAGPHRPAPTLRLPGEKLPDSPMQPVDMPKPKEAPGATPPPIPPPPGAQSPSGSSFQYAGIRQN